MIWACSKLLAYTEAVTDGLYSKNVTIVLLTTSVTLTRVCYFGDMDTAKMRLGGMIKLSVKILMYEGIKIPIWSLGHLFS